MGMYPADSAGGQTRSLSESGGDSTAQVTSVNTTSQLRQTSVPTYEICWGCIRPQPGGVLHSLLNLKNKKIKIKKKIKK